MAAKRKIAPPKLRYDLPWLELTKAQQNKLYTKALYDYGRGTGPNPGTSTGYSRERAAADVKAELAGPGDRMSVEPQPLTLAEFIAWEERQLSKHEFRAGAVYAMAGATDDHNQIVSNLMAIVRPRLRGGPCRVYANDMKLVTEYPGSRYPDLLVTGDGRDAKARLVKKYPKLIIEVVSESTAATDATDKLDEYQTIAELEEYVLIDSRKESVRIYRRNGAQLETAPAVIAGDIALVSLDITVALAAIYEDVVFGRNVRLPAL